jgi:hypothetical protein
VYFFSANDAAFSEGLGQRPRIRGNPEASALKARFTAGIAWIIIPCSKQGGVEFGELCVRLRRPPQLIRAFSACFWKRIFPGALPQA